jgi:hypothetical protein
MLKIYWQMIGWLIRAVGAVVAQFVYTEWVGGSNPSPPTWKSEQNGIATALKAVSPLTGCAGSNPVSSSRQIKYYGKISSRRNQK